MFFFFSARLTGYALIALSVQTAAVFRLTRMRTELAGIYWNLPLLCSLIFIPFMSVRIDSATGWRIKEWRFDSLEGQENLIFSTVSRPPLGAIQGTFPGNETAQE